MRNDNDKFDVAVASIGAVLLWPKEKITIFLPWNRIFDESKLKKLSILILLFFDLWFFAVLILRS